MEHTVSDHHSVADLTSLEWKNLSSSVHSAMNPGPLTHSLTSQCQAIISKTNERCTHPPKENGYCGKHKFRSVPGVNKRKHRRTKNVKIRTKPLTGFVTFSAVRHTELTDSELDFTARSEKIAQEWRDLSPEEKVLWHDKANNEFNAYKSQLGQAYDQAQQQIQQQIQQQMQQQMPQLQVDMLHRGKRQKREKLPLDKQVLMGTLNSALKHAVLTKQALETNLMEAQKLPDPQDQWSKQDIEFLHSAYELARTALLGRDVLETPQLLAVGVPLVRPFMDHELPHPTALQELDHDPHDLRHHPSDHHLHHLHPN